MKNYLLKTLLVLCAVIFGGAQGWAQDITSLPFSVDFKAVTEGTASTAPFDAGAVATGTNLTDGVLNVNNTTATAWFDTDPDTEGRQPYTLKENEEVTVSCVAYLGWLSAGGTQGIKLLNSGNYELASFTHDVKDPQVTDVKLNGTTVEGFQAFALQSYYNTSRSANGLAGNGYPYLASDDANTIVTFKLSKSGAVSLTLYNKNKGIDKTFNGTIAATAAKDIASIVVYSTGNNTDRTICIDKLSISSVVELKYNYTVNYKCGETILKTESLSGTPGSDPQISKDVIEKDGKRYEYVSDDASTIGALKEGNVYTVTYKEMDKVSYLIKGKLGDSGETIELAKGDVYKDLTPTIYYSKFQKGSDGKWYSAAAHSKEPYYGFVFAGTALEETVTFTESDVDFFYEDEDLTVNGSWNGGSAVPGRMSNGTSGRINKGSRVYTPATLAPGVYSITVGGRNESNSEYSEKFCVFDADGNIIDYKMLTWAKSATAEVTGELTVLGNYYVGAIYEGDTRGAIAIDYITLKKTGEATQSAKFKAEYTTFCPINFNVSVPEGVTAYTAKLAGTSVKLTEVSAGAALAKGKGYILKGTGTVELTYTDSEGETAASDLIGLTADKELTDVYALGYDTNGCFFGVWKSGTMLAGKAYLSKTTSASKLEIIIDDETSAIAGVSAKAVKAQGRAYNLAGQTVSDSFRGIVVKDGKKVIK